MALCGGMKRALTGGLYSIKRQWGIHSGGYAIDQHSASRGNLELITAFEAFVAFV